MDERRSRAAGASDPAVRATGLTKRYGDLDAVAGIDLEVGRGEIFGFLGPNGAGKTTTINMLSTLVAPSAGCATVAGHDVVTARTDVRRNIGLVFQDPTLDTYLSAERNLRLHAELYGVPRAEFAERKRVVLDTVGLWDRRASKVSTFSGGMRRRLEIARGLLHSPRVLFLDEPTVGLDPQTRASIWTYVAELRAREGVTIFLTTHYMDEAEYCDRIAIIDQGRIIALGTPGQLKADVGTDRVQIRTTDDGRAIEALRSRFGITATTSQDAVVFGVPEADRFVPHLVQELPVHITSINLSRPSLDDVFMSFTGTSIRDAESGAGAQSRHAAATYGRGGR